MNFKSKIKNIKNKISAVALTAVTGAANAQGLSKSKEVLTIFQTEITTIIPIIAAIALLLLGIGYATKMIEKDTLVRWGIGVIIAGSAVQITAMMFT